MEIGGQLCLLRYLMNLKMSKILSSGSTIGILGGGQLGQMLSMAAARLGFKTHIFEPSANPPASNVSSRFTQAEYDDYDKLKKFALSVDVVTYEFENIPTGALDIIEKECEIFPSREALKISQDRLLEKKFINKLGFKTASFCEVSSQEDLIFALEKTSTGLAGNKSISSSLLGLSKVFWSKEAVVVFSEVFNFELVVLTMVT